MAIVAVVTTKKPPVLIRIRPELKAAAEECARAQNRSLSNFIETILDEWLAANGYPLTAAPRNKPKGRTGKPGSK